MTMTIFQNISLMKECFVPLAPLALLALTVPLALMAIQNVKLSRYAAVLRDVNLVVDVSLVRF